MLTPLKQICTIKLRIIGYLAEAIVTCILFAAATLRPDNKS